MSDRVDLISGSTIIKSIVTDRPENDNFSISYLSVAAPASPGFMVENYIRPPVNVSIDFEKSIGVDQFVSIDFGLRVGSQLTTGVDIFAGAESSNDFLVKVASFKAVDVSDVPETVSIPLNIGVRPTAGISVFGLVAFRRLKSIKSVVIRIWRTKGCPCLKYVRIFAVIPDNIKKPVPDIPEISQLTDAPGCSAKIADHRKGLEPAESEVPEEFLDQITMEIMVLPVLLPSGKSIDRSTLERIVADQAEQGKPPTDPFTGIMFSGNSVPLPNKALKMRMDSFWIKKPLIAAKESVARVCTTNFEVFPGKRKATDASGTSRSKLLRTEKDTPAPRADTLPSFL